MEPLSEPVLAEGEEISISALNAEREDDVVHIEQAAKALRVSRRTVERMLERGDLERAPADSGAVVTKRSLVESLEDRRGATRRRVAPSQELAPLLTSLERLTATLAEERRQLAAASDDRRQVEHEREEARVEAARLQAELDAERMRRQELEQRLARRRWWRRAG